MKKFLSTLKVSGPMAVVPTALNSPIGRDTRGPTATKVPLPPEQLRAHLWYPTQGIKRFGRLALDLGFLDSADLERLLNVRESTSGRIGEIAVQCGILTQDQVNSVLQAQSLPIHVDARHVGTPAFQTWLHDLERFEIPVTVHPVSAEELAAYRNTQGGTADTVDLTLHNLNLARTVCMEAAAIRASDMHILIRETHTEIQLRIKGSLKTVKNWTMTQAEGDALVRSLCSGLATVKVEPTFNPLEFQFAQISGNVLPGSGLDSIRIIRGPMHPIERGCGFLIARLQYQKHETMEPIGPRKLVLCVPKRPEGQFNVPGLTPLQIGMLTRLFHLPYGIVIITGPTNSGKTTLMSESQHEQARLFPESRQISIESPPEYPHPTAIQLHSDPEQAVEFVAHTLRMDPDIIQLGEIRTAAEGHGAVHAARTGHFVWTTLHVTDAYRALTRLDELDPHELGLRSLCDHELITGLIAIRVVPLLCKDCRIRLADHPHKIPPFMHQSLSTWGNVEKIYIQGDGCDKCHGDGTVGRQAVAEVAITDETLMSDFLKVGILEARRRHRMKPNSDKSLLANAIDLVLEGLVDPRDVHRHVHPIEPKGEGL